MALDHNTCMLQYMYVHVDVLGIYSTKGVPQPLLSALFLVVSCLTGDLLPGSEGKFRLPFCPAALPLPITNKCTALTNRSQIKTNHLKHKQV